jgi:hypothetical protein
VNNYRGIFFLAVMVILLGATAANAQTPLLREMAKEDHDSRTGKTVVRTDDERRAIVLRLIGEGALKGPQDNFDAALILQHTGMTFCDGRLVSYSADNYLIAHYLFQSAYDGGIKDALYLIAAAMDRYLSMTVGTQKYGTNREVNQKTEKEEWVPIDRKTTDAERAKYGIPPLAELLKQFPEQATPKKKWQ